LTRALDRFAKTHVVDAVIEGNARGADRLAGFWARSRGIPNLKFNADWQKFGAAAGPIRNQRMIEEGKPIWVVAFPGGAGTADMIARAKRAGLPAWQPLAPPVAKAVGALL
jgi:hypothetical protein